MDDWLRNAAPSPASVASVPSRPCPRRRVDSSAIQRRSTRRSTLAALGSEPRTVARIFPPEMRLTARERRAAWQRTEEREAGFSSSFRRLRNREPGGEPRAVVKQALEPFAQEQVTAVLLRLRQKR